MNVAVYVRISTADQNASMQEDELRAYCKRRGLTVVGGIRTRLAGRRLPSRLTAAPSRRPPRKFDTIMVWKIDRFGRSLRHLVNALADLEAVGVAFISLRDSLDFTTPSGKLQFHVLAAAAEFERSLISERVRAGMRAGTKRGKRSGRPRTPVDPEKIRDLRSAELRGAIVAKALDIPRTVCQRAVAKRGYLVG